MAEGRMIKRSICGSKRMFEMCKQFNSYIPELFYVYMLIHVDINGICKGDIDLLKAAIFPRYLDEEHSAEALEKYLNYMKEKGMVIEYEAEGSTYIWFPDFIEKQSFSQDIKERPIHPINEEIKNHNEQIWAKKRRGHKAETSNPVPPKKQLPENKPEGDSAFAHGFSFEMAKLHSDWDSLHRKNKKLPPLIISDAQKDELNALLEKHKGKVKECLYFMYKNYDDKFLTPEWFIKNFDTVLKSIAERI